MQGGKKSKALKLRARMLMRTKVSMHVETVCLLSKLHEAKHHVNVKLDMDEMDLTAAESIHPQVAPAPQELQDKHYFRKHGANAYYGQN